MNLIFFLAFNILSAVLCYYLGVLCVDLIRQYERPDHPDLALRALIFVPICTLIALYSYYASRALAYYFPL